MMEENGKKKSFKKLRAACLISLVAILVAFGITWAFYSDSPVLGNVLQTSNTSISMVEEFNPDSSFLPGETVAKVVSFQNTGDLDLFLRVKVPPKEAWYSNDGKTEKPDLNTDRVIKNWTKAWSENEEWTDEFNGYRYYKRVLKGTGNKDAKPEERKTNPILESITLDKSVSNDRHKANYGDKIYKLTFDAQAVPVELQGAVAGDQQIAVQAEWGMTVTQNADGTLNWSKASGNGQ